MRFVLILLLASLIGPAVPAQTARAFSIEGHRGARGYLPENTIPSFEKAIELGADTVELDVVISSDKKVVVSHDHWFSHLISLDPKGEHIPKEKEKEHNIFLMPYSRVKLYDVGSLGNPGFPEQKPLKAHKPLLSEVFKALDKFTKARKLPLVRYNIEIKSAPEWDGKFHPDPAEFSSLVLKEIKRAKMAGRVKVQSFDVRPLQELRKLDPSIPIALLVGNRDGVEKSIERLGFNPAAYSPHFSLLDEVTVLYCRENGIKLIPWTANTIADLEKAARFDIDGVITDYPDRAVSVFRNRLPRK